MKALNRVALFILLVMAATGLTLASDRTQCYDDQGNYNPPLHGACFVDWAGLRPCLFGMTVDGDFYRICLLEDQTSIDISNPVQYIAKDNAKVYAWYVCPATMHGAQCLDVQDPDHDPRIDFKGGSLVNDVPIGRLAAQINWTRCTGVINASGTVSNAAGNIFQVRVKSVWVTNPNGECLPIIDELKLISGN